MSRFVVLVLGVATLSLAQPRVRFSGSVMAEQMFRQAIAPGLFFVVSPIQSQDSTGFGWRLGVEPAGGSDTFERCVTLPLHGPTPSDILAWQFVTENNEALPAAQLVPFKTRLFRFVLNAADQKRACDELDVAAAGPRTGPDGNETIGTPGYREPPLGTARVVLQNIQLADVGKGKHARFESVSFEAQFEFPDAAKRPALRRKPL